MFNERSDVVVSILASNFGGCEFSYNLIIIVGPGVGYSKCFCGFHMLIQAKAGVLR